MQSYAPDRPWIGTRAVCLFLATAGTIAELVTGMFADVAWQCFPTVWHVAAVFASIGVLIALTANGVPESRRTATLAQVAAGFAVGVTGTYALIMLPATPLMAIAVIMAGLGILAAAPYWAAVATVLTLRELFGGWQASGRSVGSFFGWMLIGAIVFPGVTIVHDLRHLGVRDHVHDFATGDAATRTTALQRLRSGPIDELLRLCTPGRSFRTAWGRGDQPAILWWYLGRRQAATPDIATTRAAFFRAHGVAHSSVPRPRPDHRWSFQPAPPPVAIRSSTIDAAVDSVAAIATVEWTLEFFNRTRRDREARMWISMPPGAVASDLSLWVRGIEQRAAFAGAGKVTRAYEAVAIRQRKDPALLNEAGPGRLSLRAFPILGTGEPMRLRMQFTVPLDVDHDAASLRLPAAMWRELHFPEHLEHAVTIAIDDEVRPVRTVPDEQLGKARISIEAPDRNAVCVAEDQDGYCIQRFTPAANMRRADRLLLVVDDCVDLARAEIRWNEVLGAWQPDTPCSIWLAGDRTVRFDGTTTAFAQKWPTRPLGIGGADPRAALDAALRELDGDEHATLIWVRGRYPLPRGEGTGWSFGKDRRGQGALVIYPTTREINTVAEMLRAVRPTLVAATTGDATTDLVALANRGWHRDAAIEESLAAFRRVLTRSDSAPVGAHVVGDPLARLWAARDARAKARSGMATAATARAIDYRLVTAGAGAVVLETAEQYTTHGLDPDAESKLDVGQPVPELETWLSLGLALLVIGLWRWRCAR